MLNFRVRDTEKQLIDEAVKRSGMTRSDFIKAWVMKGVREMGVSSQGSPTPTPTTASPAKKAAPSVSRDKCPHPLDNRTKTPYGVKVCGVCGAKLR